MMKPVLLAAGLALAASPALADGWLLASPPVDESLEQWMRDTVEHPEIGRTWKDAGVLNPKTAGADVDGRVVRARIASAPPHKQAVLFLEAVVMDHLPVAEWEPLGAFQTEAECEAALVDWKAMGTEAADAASDTYGRPDVGFLTFEAQAAASRCIPAG